MNCFQEKEVKRYGCFLLFFVLLLLLTDVCAYRIQIRAEKALFVQYSQTVASGLLEAGLSPVQAGEILRGTAVSAQGRQLTEKLGLTEHAPEQLLLQASNGRTQQLFFLIIKELVLVALLLGGALAFLQKREALYRSCVRIVEGFVQGDYSKHLPGEEEGTLYRLFFLIENLAKALRAGKEEELKTKEFLKRTISDISHQLKTPLSALSVYNQILLEEPDQADVVREFSRKSACSLSRMERLVGMLLKIARLDAKSIAFDKKPGTVRELVSLAAAELWTRAQKEGKQLLVQEEDARLFCDFAWSAEALENLIKNALDHTASGGNIRISWEETPILLYIHVSDDGEGIAPEDIPHIFKRFYRGRANAASHEPPSSMSAASPSTGLGLPLTKAIMEGQGGAVSVTSTPGEETVFTLSFLAKP